MTARPIAIVTLSGPDGPFTVAATERGVVAAEWWADEAAVLDAVRRRLDAVESVTEGPAADRLRRMRPSIDAILTGRSRDVASVPLDLADRSPFDQTVLAAVRGLGWGETASYGEIARRAGAPRAARAVGGAVGRCPVAVFIPCHRVIAADGTLGGYGGVGPGGRGDALSHKQELLAREGVTVPRRAV